MSLYMRSGIVSLGRLLTGNGIECESGDPNDQWLNVNRKNQMSRKSNDDATVHKDSGAEDVIEMSSD